MQSIVEAEGYDVVTAYNGEQCFQKLKEGKPDLIVLDVMMPGMDGWEVCQRLKDDEDNRNIPIIMLTAVGSQVQKTTYTHRGGMETDGDDYIPKPVKPLVLLKRIRKFLK